MTMCKRLCSSNDRSVTEAERLLSCHTLGHIKHNLLFLCSGMDGNCGACDKNNPTICKQKGPVVYIAKNVCLHSL